MTWIIVVEVGNVRKMIDFSVVSIWLGNRASATLGCMCLKLTQTQEESQTTKANGSVSRRRCCVHTSPFLEKKVCQITRFHDHYNGMRSITL